VRTIEGALPQRFGRADPKAKPAHWPYSDVGLRFSNDGRRLARFLERDGWRIWSLSNGEEQFVAGRDTIDEVADFAPPRPKDWFVESGAMTVFSHRPSGVRIAMPLAGPSACNPADTRILAFGELHVELRAH
jgi:hypothetical protein